MNTATKPITPERERELVDRLVDFLNSRYSGGDLYDILRHTHRWYGDHADVSSTVQVILCITINAITGPSLNSFFA